MIAKKMNHDFDDFDDFDDFQAVVAKYGKRETDGAL